jgi:2-dehydro-3-deoxygluconokinase
VDGRPASPSLLAIGDALIALTPHEPVSLEETADLAVHIGGAELNTAIGVRRLGLEVSWLGRIGDDPLGRRVLRTLRAAGVHTETAVLDPGAPTGLYLREWLPDGLRRPYYYRQGSAGSRLRAEDWPDPWPSGVPRPTVLHVTGITSALSATAAGAITAMLAESAVLGCLISVDPNYRPVLWPEEAVARQRLRELVSMAGLVLLSEDDAQLLFGSTDPDVVRDALQALSVPLAVFKRGAAGAIAWRGADTVEVPAERVRAVDPVGAGDGFNAGFLAATMLGLDLDLAMRCGAWCGARAVERVGDNAGYPTLDELPDDLRAALSRPAAVQQQGVN